MNPDEMDDAIKKARDTFEAKRQQIWRGFAVANNVVNIGDTIKGNMGKIKVEHMKATFSFGGKYPEMLYYGPRLKADGTPFKTGERLQVHQSTIVSKDEPS
jgi:hypothetical protein